MHYTNMFIVNLWKIDDEKKDVRNHSNTAGFFRSLLASLQLQIVIWQQYEVKFGEERRTGLAIKCI